MICVRLLIARHAEDKGHGIVDDERVLTKKGIHQANKLANVVKEFKPTHIYCSNLLRSKQTAEIVSMKCNISVNETELLKEQEIDDINESINELKLNRGYVNLDEVNQGWESFGNVTKRSKEFYKDLIERHKHEDRIAIISHGRFMTFQIAVILDFKPDGFFLANNNIAYLIIEIPRNWRPMIVLPTAGSLYI
ncbi:MAG: histidine phosphatase family protein [Asgard group archaeon]|nr:histidine phosphatase family protein [Asgard group archaeon]